MKRRIGLASRESQIRQERIWSTFRSPRSGRVHGAREQIHRASLLNFAESSSWLLYSGLELRIIPLAELLSLKLPSSSWIENRIFLMNDGLQIRTFLNTVRTQLLRGKISDEMKLQEEIGEIEYKDWFKRINEIG